MPNWHSTTIMAGLAPGKRYEVWFADGTVKPAEWHPFWKSWFCSESDEVFDEVPVQWREVGS